MTDPTKRLEMLWGQNMRIVIVYLVFFVMGGGCVLFWSDDSEDKNAPPGPRDEYAELRNRFADEKPANDPLDSFGISRATHDYLANRVGVSAFGDKVFCSYEHLGNEEKGGFVDVYLWVFCSEIYPAHDTLREGGGVSQPLVLKLEKRGSDFVVIEHQAPEFGEGYVASVKSLFPGEYHSRIFPDQYGLDKHSESIEFLKFRAYEDAADYYKLEDN